MSSLANQTVFYNPACRQNRLLEVDRELRHQDITSLSNTHAPYFLQYGLDYADHVLKERLESQTGNFHWPIEAPIKTTAAVANCSHLPGVVKLKCRGAVCQEAADSSERKDWSSLLFHQVKCRNCP